LSYKTRFINPNSSLKHIITLYTLFLFHKNLKLNFLLILQNKGHNSLKKQNNSRLWGFINRSNPTLHYYNWYARFYINIGHLKNGHLKRLWDLKKGIMFNYSMIYTIRFKIFRTITAGY